MRQKHVPTRTCVGCRTNHPKRDLIRVVRDPEGKVHLDLTGKLSGRGAYLCQNDNCLEKAVKGRQLDRALQLTISSEILDDLKRVLNEQNV